MKRVACVMTMLIAALSACNTIQGVGKDIEKGGQAIEKAVSK